MDAVEMIEVPGIAAVEPAAVELLLASVRRTADPQRLAQLAAQIRNLDALCRLAREHRMSAALFLVLMEAGVSLAAPLEQALHAEYQRNVLLSMANAAELIAVLEALERASIAVLPFKGVVLAASAWGSLPARAAGDLDLLIRQQDLERAAAILLNRGFELRTPVLADGTPAARDSCEYHFERSSDGMLLELRWRLELTQPRFRRNLGLDWAWPTRRTAMLAGAEVPAMSPEITLLVLSMHGSKHFWSRLVWICDIARLLASAPELDWQQVVTEGRRTGLLRCLALGVLLAHRVAGAEVPPAVLHRFQSDAAAQRLARHFELHLFDAPGMPPPGRIPYNLQLLDARDRLSFLFSPELLRPNARDRAAFALPRMLEPLYYVLRPLRILRDRSPR